MTYTRFIMCAVALPGGAALAVLSAIVLPDGDQLSWLRFSVGMVAYLTVQIGGSAIAGLVIKRTEGHA